MGRGGRKGQVANTLRGSVSFNDIRTGEEVLVVPGRLDEAAENAYINGQCAYLALALRERTGGQIWAIVDPAYDDDEIETEIEEITDSRGQFYEDLIPNHFGVEMNGEMLDINGSESFEMWEERHGGRAFPVTGREIAEWQTYHQRANQFTDPAPDDDELLELARSFVDPVLERARGE